MIATVAAMLAACSNEENEVNNGPVEARITARIDGPQTRAVDQSWSAGNTIGVRVTGVTGTSTMQDIYKNVKYTVGSAGLTGIFTAESGGINQEKCHGYVMALTDVSSGSSLK